MDIAKADTVEMQRELLKAYESKDLNQVSIRTVKRLMDQRQFAGKQRDSSIRPGRKRLTSAESRPTPIEAVALVADYGDNLVAVRSELPSCFRRHDEIR